MELQKPTCTSIVDDHELDPDRNAGPLIGQREGWEIVGEALNGEEAHPPRPSNQPARCCD